MCGRMCLTLEPGEIQCACKYKKISNKKTTNNATVKKEFQKVDVAKGHKEGQREEKENIPEWRSEFNFGRKYLPSRNIAPSDVTPVLISADHFDANLEVDSPSRVLLPMMWGMIPFWHKGDYTKHGLTTNNCRLEHMLESKLYRGPFRKGQRCVVICEGFYEWQTTKTTKPSERKPHFIYMPQENDVKIYDKTTYDLSKVKLLKMAGLFDIWEDANGDKMYSYSVITYESNDVLNWLHRRTPAILETEEQVNNWLDFKNISDEEALAALCPPKKLCWYEVSNLVNNSRNKSEHCNKPLSEIKDMCSWTPKSKIMQSWLIIRKRKEEKIKEQLKDSDDDIDYHQDKRFKFTRCKQSGGETTTDAETTDLEIAKIEKDEIKSKV